MLNSQVSSKILEREESVSNLIEEVEKKTVDCRNAISKTSISVEQIYDMYLFNEGIKQEFTEIWRLLDEVKTNLEVIHYELEDGFFGEEEITGELNSLLTKIKEVFNMIERQKGTISSEE